MKRKPSAKKTSDSNEEKSFAKRYEEDLMASSRYLKEHYGRNIMKQQKLSYLFILRRIKAYSNYAKLIREAFGDKLQGLNIENELSFIGSMPFMPNLDVLNGFFYISLAIAIYILDTLNDCGRLSEAIMCIPSEQNALQSVVLPEKFHYPTYSNDLIRGVILLIEGRNQNTGTGCNKMDVFYNERNSNSLKPESKICPEKPSVSLIQSMNYEQRLKCLISYIPQNVLTRVERNWKEAINQCTALLLKEFEYIESKEYEQETETRPLTEEQKTALKANVVFNFINRNRYGTLHAQKSKRTRLKIENPYEICFAAFYFLAYKDDDYAWLIELCGIIVEMACEMFPWYRQPDFSSQPEIIYLNTTVLSLNAVYYSLWDGATDAKEDVSYVRDTLCKIVYRKEGYILPQNDPLLKRFMFMQKGFFEILLEISLFAITVPIFFIIFLKLYFLEANSVSIALVALVSFLVLFRKELHTLNMLLFKRILKYFLIRRITRNSEISFQNNINRIRSQKDYEKELDELNGLTTVQREELSKCKSQLHDALKTIEEQKAQFNILKAKYDANRSELVELRETIYNIQNSTELEVEVQNMTPHFPFSTNKKILIVGGHEKWISAMKLYIPDAVYINPSSLNFDVALIRSADVLWLQTNAMPHALYYKIIDKARSLNIPIKYFLFASSKKCATQIFMFENTN